MHNFMKLLLVLFSLALAVSATSCMEPRGIAQETAVAIQNNNPEPSTWSHLSSANGDLPPPSSSTQQTASLILDIDKDGVQDFVIGIRQPPGPSLVWYQHTPTGWQKYVIDNQPLQIEAGGAYYDIDDDGDLDIVMGGDSSSNQVWWWENPYPTYEPNTNWTRRLIKNSGAAKHHDQMFGDFDGDNQTELVFWNQGAATLFLAEIPADPKTTQPWTYTPIFSWSGSPELEGFSQADMNGDNKIDIVGGGRWFEHTNGTNYTVHIIDDTQRFTRAAAGQLIADDTPEVVFVPGDASGTLKWYEWNGSSWVSHDLFFIDHGHSLQIEDVDLDGNLDIFVAEMRLDGGNPDAGLWILYGDGSGNFSPSETASGFGNHESRLGDLDGDGDVDILGKPYNWDTPRVDIWINELTCAIELDQWQRHVIDAERPLRAIFVLPADLNGDDLADVVSGGWWYQNPGTPGGSWIRQPIGAPLNNVAALYDFDGDGDIDILGTQGEGSEWNSSFVWAQNDGSGNFTILTNISDGSGDFLQGVATAAFQPGATTQVGLSWHNSTQGTQMLTLPADPVNNTWTWHEISTTTQYEDLSTADIDRDGDEDLLLGTIWLRNEALPGAQSSGPWTAFTLFNTTDSPDRNKLADMNGDGRVDAVVGYEAVNMPGKLAWYEQPLDPTGLWNEHIIANVVGPMSVDVADMDGDNDFDVIVGEHNYANPETAKMLVFENTDVIGSTWQAYTVYTGDEHHDGAQTVDIDNDGDLDIISIGWNHNQVLLYENLSSGCASTNPPDPTPTPTATATPDPDWTPTPTPTSTPTPDPNACLPSSGNLIANHSFEEGVANWSFYTNGSGTFSVGTPSSHCDLAGLVNISLPGSNTQLYQHGISLKANTTYVLQFDAFASNTQSIEVELLNHVSPYENYGLDDAVTLTPGWQTYEIIFTTNASVTPANNGRFRFWLPNATSGTGFGFDRVSLEEWVEETAVAPDLDIAIDSNPLDVELSWTTHINNAGYVPWRSTTSYFSPEDAGATQLDTLPGTVSSYVDPNHIGDAAVNYFYLVEAFNVGAASSVTSNLVGEFDFAIVPGE